MSGYFAALAAQVSVGGASAGPTSAVSSLEQHVEVETTTVAAQAPSVAPTQAAPPLVRQAALPRDEASPQARHPATAVPTAIEQPPRVPSSIEPVPSSPVGRDIVAPLETSVVSPAEPIVRSIPSPQPLVRESEFATTHSVDVSTARSATPLALTESVVAPRTEQAQTRAVRVTPSVRDQRRSVATNADAPIAPKHSDATHRPSIEPVALAIPRTDVRIGTISLEVRVPAAAPRAAPVAPITSTRPAAPIAPSAPASSAPRFSLQRHYLRWS
jgi:hypothetical protein